MGSTLCERFTHVNDSACVSSGPVHARHIACTRAIACLSQLGLVRLQHGIHSLKIQPHANTARVSLCHLETFCMPCVVERRVTSEWIRRTRPQVALINGHAPPSDRAAGPLPPFLTSIWTLGELKCWRVWSFRTFENLVVICPWTEPDLCHIMASYQTFYFLPSLKQR